MLWKMFFHTPGASMKIRLVSAIVFALALGAANAQDANTAPTNAPAAGQNPAQSARGWQGQRGGRGRMGGPGLGGRGVVGTVTAVAADHYAIKTDAGETYTVHFSVNTRIVKQAVPRQLPSDASPSVPGPQALKPADIKVGDAVAALGDVDAAAKSVGAITVVKIDPERAKQMREMQASYGKTWLAGKITAIDGVRVTLLGSVDNIGRTFVADENTTFRRRREPITLADVQVGDAVRVEGAVKDGTFVATSVSVMGMPTVTVPPPAN
jgi:hypothetical protein